MAEKKDFKLQQTKGNFKLQGVITGIAKEGVFREGETKSDEGKVSKYRSIRFNIKTSPTNTIPVELYGSEQDVVYAYSRTNKDTKKITWKDRLGKFENTYHLIGVNITNKFTSDGVIKEAMLSDVVEEFSKLKKDESKEIKMTCTDYDAVKVINESFNDGDSVYITGELKPNPYINAQGEFINGFKYTIKSISKQKKEIDFEDEMFQEIASFDCEMIVTDTLLVEAKSKDDIEKVIINAYAIGYADSFKQIQFAIHCDKNKKLGEKFTKLNFGDYIKVLGVCINAPTGMGF